MSDFFRTLSTQYNIYLNDQQKAAVIHGKGPALVLAGPGSGKTTVITARAAHLILDVGIPPDQILTLTFNKAAQLEMKNRFHRIFGETIKNNIHFSTLHSFCYSVIKDYEKRQGKSLKLIEGDSGDVSYSKQHILKELYKESNRKAINEEELETLMNDIGFIKNKMIKDFEELNFQTSNFKDIYRAYEDYKKQNLLMDFDDMLTFCHSILRRCPEILYRYKNSYKYFQVDEGQDLSKIQFEILKMLVASGENNLFLVADDDQSIYGFRGAEPRHILELGTHFNELKLFKLENNYRSSKNLVEISSQFIRSNSERYDKSHKTNNPDKYPPELVRVKDEQEQLAFVENKIKEHFLAKRDCKIAVLYRNNLSSIALVDRFERGAIPYKLKQNRVHFFQHWLVQDILAFFKFALDPCDKESFLRIYFKMNRYISRIMVETAINSGLQLPILECILRTSELKPFQTTKIHDVIKEFRGLSKMSPFKALQTIEQDFKYFGSVKDYCDHTGLSLDYMVGLFGILKTLSQSTQTLTAFISRLEELNGLLDSMQPSSRLSDGSTPVTLTTIHSSKGLEYDVVFMVDLTNREIPGDKALSKSRKDNDDSLIEEERRLFYVGLTRARTWLYLVSPELVNDQTGSRSIFINEVASFLNKEMSDRIGEGIIIHHNKYGEGVVSRIQNQFDNTIIDVDFKGLTRSFDLAVCLENGIISIIHSARTS